MTVPHRARDPRHGAAAARPRTAAERGTKAPAAQSRVRAGAERSADTGSRDTGDQGEENMRVQCSEKLNVTHAVTEFIKK